MKKFILFYKHNSFVKIGRVYSDCSSKKYVLLISDEICLEQVKNEKNLAKILNGQLLSSRCTCYDNYTQGMAIKSFSSCIDVAYKPDEVKIIHSLKNIKEIKDETLYLIIKEESINEL